MRKKIIPLKILVTAVTLGLVAMKAFGATTNLVCTYVGGSTNTGSISVVLDDGARTAVFGDDPTSPANFSDAEVTWGKVETRDADRQYNKFYKLNRGTGTLILSGAEKAESDPQWIFFKGYYHCAAAQR
jgi:hypothetical protein